MTSAYSFVNDLDLSERSRSFKIKKLKYRKSVYFIRFAIFYGFLILYCKIIMLVMLSANLVAVRQISRQL